MRGRGRSPLPALTAPASSSSGLLERRSLAANFPFESIQVMVLWGVPGNGERMLYVTVQAFLFKTSKYP